MTPKPLKLSNSWQKLLFSWQFGNVNVVVAATDFVVYEFFFLVFLLNLPIVPILLSSLEPNSGISDIPKEKVLFNVSSPTLMVLWKTFASINSHKQNLLFGTSKFFSTPRKSTSVFFFTSSVSVSVFFLSQF